MRILFRQFDRFVRQDEAGGLSVEAVLIFPILLWVTIASFTFFESYKTAYSALRANSTISDLLSRETIEIDQDYLDGMHRAFRFLSSADDEDSWLRVTVIECNSNCNDDDRELGIVWSESVNGARPLDADDLVFYDARIPIFTETYQLVIVETSVETIPSFSNWVPAIQRRDLQHFAINRPRFAPNLNWADDTT